MKIALGQIPPGEGPPLLDLELTDPDRYGDFNEGELAATGGNLYIFIDGQEWGSLYFNMQDGQPSVRLGQYDHASDEWKELSKLTRPVQPENKEQS